MTAYTGSCHCGEITYEVTMEPDKTKHVLCHCGACQKISGGSYTLNQIVPKSALNFTKGGDKLKKYTYKGDSGHDVDCYFCPTCTASPYHHQTVLGPDLIVLRTILLDKGKEFEPAAEVYGKFRLPWVKEVAHTFEILPPQ